MIKLRKKKINKYMKKIIIITSMLLFSSSFINAAEPKCDTRLSKLNPDCNFIGKGFKKMKDFSKKTIGSDSQPLFENLHQPSSRDMTTRSNYEATSQLMSFIKAKNAGNMALKSTKDSLNKNYLKFINFYDLYHLMSQNK